MWNLPVRNLFMVGGTTEEKLAKSNIQTIGELAKYDINILKPIFKSHATMIHNYANGVDNSEVRNKNYLDVKEFGNSITTSKDIETRDNAVKILLSLTERTAMRLRNNSNMCSVISVSLKTNGFIIYSYQKTFPTITHSTNEIFNEITKIFDESWKSEPIKQFGIRLSNLCSNDFYQRSFFDDINVNKKRTLDKTIDAIWARFGDTSIMQSTFLNSGIKPLSGGITEDDYPMMRSIL